jgi:hypothetical protein
VQRTLHLIEHVVVCAAQDDARRGHDLGALDEDQLVVRHALLHDLVRVAEIRGLERLIAIKVREARDERAARCARDAPQIFLATAPHGHRARLDELLEPEVIDALGREYDVRTRAEDLMDAVERDARLAVRTGSSAAEGAEEEKKGHAARRDVPLPDLLELLRVFDEDLDAELHARFTQVDVETRNLRVGYPRLHRWLRAFSAGARRKKKNGPATARALKRKRTLARDGAVERVALDKDGFARAAAVGLEDVDGLDGIFCLAAPVDGLDGEHGVNGHRCEEVVVAVQQKHMRIAEHAQGRAAGTHLLMILLAMVVFATLMSAGRPSASTETESWSCMNLTASRHARR